MTPAASEGGGRWRGTEIEAKLTNAPGNGASIGGLKVTTKNGWFAARPSGTENIYKIYAESFVSQVHLEEIIREAQTIVGAALGGVSACIPPRRPQRARERELRKAGMMRWWIVAAAVLIAQQWLRLIVCCVGDLSLWYDHPAKDRQSECLPIRNVEQLGAMVYGDARRMSGFS